MKTNYVEANLGRASFLRWRGYKLAEIVPIGHRMVAFSFFDHDGKARETVSEFSAGGSSSAENLLSCLADLKTMMYEFKTQKEGKEANDVDRKRTHQTIRN